jgi:hypothetical protein
MANARAELRSKPFGVRIQEFIQSLQVVRDSLEGIRKGQTHQFIPLYGQMRALLTDRAKGVTPLLLEIARALNQPLQFFAMTGPDNPEFPASSSPALLMHFAGFPVGLQRTLPKQQEVSFPDYLEAHVIHYRGETYTVRNIIDKLAQFSGGAHYAAKVGSSFAELSGIELFGQQPLQAALVQLAGVTYSLGVRLLKLLCNLDVHLVLFVPAQKLDKVGVILDSRYPETAMAFGVALQPDMRLTVAMVGIQRTRVTLTTATPVNSSNPRHVLVTRELTDELKTNIEITVDGSERTQFTATVPIFLPADPTDFDTYWNRSAEEVGRGLTFGLARVLSIGGELRPINRARLLLRNNQEQFPARAFHFFTPGNYGHEPPGTKTMQMHGTVRIRTLESLQTEYRP